MNNASEIPHQYQNVAFTENDVETRIPSDPQTATDAPLDPQETTSIPLGTHGTTSTPLGTHMTTSTPLGTQGTTSIPFDTQVITSAPTDPEDTGSISSDSSESTSSQPDLEIEINTLNPQVSTSIPLDREESLNIPSHPPQIIRTPSSDSTASTSVPLQPLGVRRNHLPPNLTPVNVLGYPLVDKEVTVPPPPYWSIDSANDILASPTITTSQPSNEQILSTAPPPAYNTLYDFEPPVRPQDTACPEAEPQNTPEPAIQERQEGRAIWLYSLVIGVVIPVFMIILKHAVECRAKRSITDSLIPGIVFHILHGLTTILTGGKLLCGKARNYDFFVLLIFGWTVAVSIMVYRLDKDQDCDTTLYYFLFSLLTVYNIVFGVLILYLIKPFLESIKIKLRAAICS